MNGRDPISGMREEKANEKTHRRKRTTRERELTERSGDLSEMLHCASSTAVASRGYYHDNISDGAAQNAQLDMKSAKKKREQVRRREKKDEIGMSGEGLEKVWRGER